MITFVLKIGPAALVGNYHVVCHPRYLAPAGPEGLASRERCTASQAWLRVC